MNQYSSSTFFSKDLDGRASKILDLINLTSQPSPQGCFPKQLISTKLVEEDEYLHLFYYHLENFYYDQGTKALIRMLLQKYIGLTTEIMRAFLITLVIRCLNSQTYNYYDNFVSLQQCVYQPEVHFFISALIQETFTKQYLNCLEIEFGNKMKKSLLEQPYYSFDYQSPDIMFMILADGSIVINQTVLSYSFLIRALILYHANVISSQFPNICGVIQNNWFCSEILGFPIHLKKFSQLEFQQINKLDNWTDFKSLKQHIFEIQKLQRVTNDCQSIQSYTQHNPCTKRIIEDIEMMIAELYNKAKVKLTNKFVQTPSRNYPYTPLTKQYSPMEYLTVVRSQLFQIISNSDSPQNYKIVRYIKFEKDRLFNTFTFLQTNTNALNQILAETTFLWGFLWQRKQTLTFDCSADLLKCQVDLKHLDEQDVVFIDRIARSQVLKPIIMTINSIDNRYCSGEQFEEELQYFRRFLTELPIVVYDRGAQETQLHGVALMNGFIALDRSCFNENTQQVRAFRTITIIHELYCHIKRREYVCPDNILKVTPDKVSDLNDQSLVECGYFFENTVFGQVVHSVNAEQAIYILDVNNWENQSSEQFQIAFKNIPQAPLKQVAIKIHGAKASSPIKKKQQTAIKCLGPIPWYMKK